MKIEIKTYGAEIEKPISSIKTGGPQGVSQDFFERLKESAQQRGTFDRVHKSDINQDITIGIVSKDLGDQGLDNGWNLQETSLPYQKSLNELQQLMSLDVQTIQQSLEQEGASVINLSIHPLGKRGLKEYAAYVAPKGVYPFIWHRGWDHTAGIDARAQNSPTTGVASEDAADAVSAVIGAGAAFVGLFANSPFEEGRRSNYKETRLTMWERMMRNAKVEGDRVTARFPAQRFRTLAEYFNWMHGRQTGIHFVIADNEKNNSDYKGIGDRILIVHQNPSVLEYLSQPSWEAVFINDIQHDFPPKQTHIIKPNISHMEAMQFAQFAGARIRYGIKDHDNFPLQEFVEACRNPNSRRVEEIFTEFARYVYIEGRDPGANFPDEEVKNAGDQIASTVIVSPSSIQAGLIKNLEEATSYINSFQWNHLKALREAAIKDGLQGKVDNVTVYDFSKQIVDIAGRGLSSQDHQLLQYPEWVLKMKQNGADRAISFVEKHKGSTHEAIHELVKKRTV